MNFFNVTFEIYEIPVIPVKKENTSVKLFQHEVIDSSALCTLDHRNIFKNCVRYLISQE